MLFYRIKKYLKAGLVATLLASLCIYFGFHLFDGERGLISFWKLQDSQIELHAKLVRLQDIRHEMERIVDKLSSNDVDGDYLDELSRKQLGLVGKNDLIILRPKSSDYN